MSTDAIAAFNAAVGSACDAELLAAIPPEGISRAELHQRLAHLSPMAVDMRVLKLVNRKVLVRPHTGFVALAESPVAEVAQARTPACGRCGQPIGSMRESKGLTTCGRCRSARADQGAYGRGVVRLSSKRLTRADLDALAAEGAAFPERPGVDYDRPRTRAECPTGPCPHAACRYHLAVDVERGGLTLAVNFPGKEIDEMPATCALQEAGRGGLTLEQVAERMHLTRERTRQLEDRALAKLRERAPWLLDALDQAGRGARHLPVLQDDEEVTGAAAAE